MSRLRVLMAAAGIAALGGSAHGATVVTPVLFPGNATQAFCIVLNSGTKDVEVALELVNAVTGVVKAGGPPVTVTAGLMDFTNDSTPVPSYCRVTGASPRKIRVTLCMVDAAGSCIATSTAP